VHIRGIYTRACEKPKCWSHNFCVTGDWWLTCWSMMNGYLDASSLESHLFVDPLRLNRQRGHLALLLLQSDAEARGRRERLPFILPGAFSASLPL
jgi:hypothetical protein